MTSLSVGVLKILIVVVLVVTSCFMPDLTGTAGWIARLGLLYLVALMFLFSTLAIAGREDQGDDTWIREFQERRQRWSARAVASRRCGKDAPAHAIAPSGAFAGRGSRD
jgi:hypothetical protein